MIKEVALTGTDKEIKIPLKGINQGIYFLQLGKETKKFLVAK
uniref:T9SS type A sorting domain-containing protein n=1 Tax=candidate division WOR-3 bacterium TaxID=2052148 RepID=A0A7C6A7Z7_UNCW3